VVEMLHALADRWRIACDVVISQRLGDIVLQRGRGAGNYRLCLARNRVRLMHLLCERAGQAGEGVGAAVAGTRSGSGSGSVRRGIRGMSLSGWFDSAASGGTEPQRERGERHQQDRDGQGCADPKVVAPADTDALLPEDVQPQQRR